MAKAELYKITINDGKVMLRIPQQLVGAETASMDDIQAELHLRNLNYVPEQLLEIYNRTSGEFDYLADVETNDYTLQIELSEDCLLYTSPSPRDLSTSRMPSSA